MDKETNLKGKIPKSFFLFKQLKNHETLNFHLQFLQPANREFSLKRKVDVEVLLLENLLGINEFIIQSTFVADVYK